MKKNIIKIGLVLGLTFMLAGCGNKTENVENAENTENNATTDAENKEESKTTYEVKELGEYEYELYLTYDDLYIINDKDLNFGCMNTKGEVIVEPQYEGLSYGDGVLTIRKPQGEGINAYYYYADLDGTPIIEEVDGKKIVFAQDFKDGYALVTLEVPNEVASYVTNVVINKKGEVVYRRELDESGDVGVFRDEYDGNIVDLKFNKIFNSDMTELAESEKAKLENYNNDDIYQRGEVYYKVNENGERAIYDINERKEISKYRAEAYDTLKIGDNYAIFPFEGDDTMCVQIIDAKGNIVKDLAEGYESILQPMADGDKLVLIFADGKKVVVLDQNGEVYKQTNLDYVSKTLNGTRISYVSSGETSLNGYLDEEYNEILPAEYEKIGGIHSGVGVMQNGNMFYQFFVK